MQRRVYIGNLAVSMDSTQLEILFSTIGNVENAKVVSGLGVVEMSTEAEALNCVEYFHGQEQDGLAMRVSQVAPKPRPLQPQPTLSRRRSS